jgi:multiple sugar transport system substrate-binding protein
MSGLIGAAALVGPQVLIRKASAKDDKQLVFISEESNPKAIAVYEKINAEFTKETGIKVVMEYPGFTNIHKRVATLIASGTPADLVWYGAAQAMDVALEGLLADLTDLANEFEIDQNQRLMFKGACRNVATSQQFVYCWYRKDLYEQKGIKPFTTWEEYLAAAKALNDPPRMYGCIIPSSEMGASHLLMETAMMTNAAHWFKYDSQTKKYSVCLDEGENKKAVVETLEFLHEMHKYSPEASTYNWAELMSTFASEKVANSYYVGARLLEQVMANNARIGDVTAPLAFPPRKTPRYYLSVQGFHVHKDSNVEGARKYIRFFIKHPDYIKWLHAVPLHIIPASRKVLQSAAYQDNPIVQKRMDVLKFLDSIWGKGLPPYYSDGPELNPLVGLYQNANLGGWMLAMRNIKGQDASSVVDQAAEKIREKMKAKS